MTGAESRESSGERSAEQTCSNEFGSRLPYDINLWCYLLPSVEKSSMRDHYSFSALTATAARRTTVACSRTRVVTTACSAQCCMVLLCGFNTRAAAQCGHAQHGHAQPAPCYRRVAPYNTGLARSAQFLSVRSAA